MREDAKQNHCIVGLREYPVRDEAEIMRLLEDGTIQPRSPVAAIDGWMDR